MNVFVHRNRKSIVAHAPKHNIIAPPGLRIVSRREFDWSILLVFLYRAEHDYPNRLPRLLAFRIPAMLKETADPFEILQNSSRIAFASAAEDFEVIRRHSDPLGFGAACRRQCNQQSAQ